MDIGFYSDADEMKQHLRKVLHSLIRDGGVSSKDIIILIPRRLDRSLLSNARLGPYVLSTGESRDLASVRFTNIQRFRGMERKVVVIAEMDTDVGELERMVYLGASRAKTKLIMLCSEQLPPQFKGRLVENCRLLEN